MQVAGLTAMAVGGLGPGRRRGRIRARGAVPGGRAPRRPSCRIRPALAGVIVRPGVIHVGRALASAPTTAVCEQDYQVACYQPAQIQQAYNLPALYASGVTGRGRTIVIVDSYGSPTITHDLGVFDKTFNLPAPPSFTIIQPEGRCPPTTRPTPTWSAGPGRPRWTSSTRTRWRPAPHPAGRDAGGGNRGRARLPADRGGRGLRDRPSPRRRDQPELQRHRADLPRAPRPRAARRLPKAARRRRHRAGRRGRHGVANVQLDETTYYTSRSRPGRTATRWSPAWAARSCTSPRRASRPRPTVWNDTFSTPTNEFV